MRHLRISKGGQVSVPAEVRKRWGTSRVVVEDRGDEIVLRPAADDPIEALVGKYRDAPGPTVDAVRRELREEDTAREDRP